jgi:hypothetical protein
MKRIKIFGHSVPLPGNIVLRVGLGILLILGGIFSILPVLGLWMLPLGLLVLSIDFPRVRRFRRRSTVKVGHWIMIRAPKFAQKIGFGQRRNSRNFT